MARGLWSDDSKSKWPTNSCVSRSGKHYECMHSAIKYIPKISLRGKTPLCQTRNGYLHNEGKVESSSFSEVVRSARSFVQRYSGDDSIIRWLNSSSQFSHNWSSSLTGIVPTHAFINLHAFWLVLTYDLFEDWLTDDVIINACVTELTI